MTRDIWKYFEISKVSYKSWLLSLPVLFLYTVLTPTRNKTAYKVRDPSLLNLTKPEFFLRLCSLSLFYFAYFPGTDFCPLLSKSSTLFLKKKPLVACYKNILGISPKFQLRVLENTMIKLHIILHSSSYQKIRTKSLNLPWSNPEVFFNKKKFLDN